MTASLRLRANLKPRASPKSYTVLVQFKADRATVDWLETVARENKVTTAAYLRAIITDARFEPKTVPQGIPVECR